MTRPSAPPADVAPPDRVRADGAPAGPRPGRAAPAGAPEPGGTVPAPRPQWTFLTNHGHVLLAVTRSRDARVSEIAAQVGISGRATLSILKDLESAGYLSRQRNGRRSHYTVDEHRPFRHPTVAAHEIGELLAVLAPAEDRGEGVVP